MKSLLVVLIVISLALTSCATNGYGCKGRSKVMTRVTDRSPWKIR